MAFQSTALLHVSGPSESEQETPEMMGKVGMHSIAATSVILVAIDPSDIIDLMSSIVQGGTPTRYKKPSLSN